MKRSVSSKLILRIVLALLLAQLVWTVPAVVRTRTRVLRGYEDLVNTVSRQIESVAESPTADTETVRHAVAPLLRRHDMNVLVFDGQGRLLAGTGTTPDVDALLRRAMATHNPVRERLRTIRPIRGGSDGFVFVAVPPRIVFRVWTDEVFAILATSLAAAALAGLLSIYAIRAHVLSPISQIIQALVSRAQEGEGELIADEDIPDDEFGDIMRGQNETLSRSMAYQKELRRKNRLLRRERQALRKWGAKLEQRVQKKSQIVELAREKLVQSEKLAGLGKLAAGVAREVHRPLASIAQLASALLQKGQEENLQSADSFREFLPALQQVREQAERGQEITKRLLSFAQQTEFVVEEVDVNELANETLELTRYRIGSQNIEVALAPDPDLPRLATDRSHLQQLLMNLLDNAVEAVGEKGRIHVATSHANGRVRIDVHDSGPGIPPELQNRIFDPFFTTKPAGQGTGLGLSLCYGIVTKLRGAIDFSSEPGKGTTFRVELPLAVEPDEGMDARS